MIISTRQCWSDGPTEGDEEDGSDNTSEDEGNKEGDDSEQDCMFVFFHDILLFLILLFP